MLPLGHRLEGDIIDTLPGVIAQRVRIHRDRTAEALASLRLMSDRVAQQRETVLDVERQLKLLHRDRDPRAPQFGGPADRYIETEEVAQLDEAARRIAEATWIGPRDLPQVRELKTRLRRSFDEMRRLETQAEPKTEKWQQRARLAKNVKDFLRVGIPLSFICWIVSCLLIPLIWPFHP